MFNKRPPPTKPPGATSSSIPTKLKSVTVFKPKPAATPMKRSIAKSLLNKSRSSVIEHAAMETLRTNNTALAKRNAELEGEVRVLKEDVGKWKRKFVQISVSFRGLLHHVELSRDISMELSQSFFSLHTAMNRLTNHELVELPNFEAILEEDTSFNELLPVHAEPQVEERQAVQSETTTPSPPQPELVEDEPPVHSQPQLPPSDSKCEVVQEETPADSEVSLLDLSAKISEAQNDSFSSDSSVPVYVESPALTQAIASLTALVNSYERRATFNVVQPSVIAPVGTSVGPIPSAAPVSTAAPVLNRTFVVQSPQDEVAATGDSMEVQGSPSVMESEAESTLVEVDLDNSPRPPAMFSTPIHSSLASPSTAPRQSPRQLLMSSDMDLDEETILGPSEEQEAVTEITAPMSETVVLVAQETVIEAVETNSCVAPTETPAPVSGMAIQMTQETLVDPNSCVAPTEAPAPVAGPAIPVIQETLEDVNSSVAPNETPAPVNDIVNLVAQGALVEANSCMAPTETPALVTDAVTQETLLEANSCVTPTEAAAHVASTAIPVIQETLVDVNSSVAPNETPAPVSDIVNPVAQEILAEANYCMAPAESSALVTDAVTQETLVEVNSHVAQTNVSVRMNVTQALIADSLFMEDVAVVDELVLVKETSVEVIRTEDIQNQPKRGKGRLSTKSPASRMNSSLHDISDDVGSKVSEGGSQNRPKRGGQRMASKSPSVSSKMNSSLHDISDDVGSKVSEGGIQNRPKGGGQRMANKSPSVSSRMNSSLHDISDDVGSKVSEGGIQNRPKGGGQRMPSKSPSVSSRMNSSIHEISEDAGSKVRGRVPQNRAKTGRKRLTIRSPGSSRVNTSLQEISEDSESLVDSSEATKTSQKRRKGRQVTKPLLHSKLNTSLQEADEDLELPVGSKSNPKKSRGRQAATHSRIKPVASKRMATEDAENVAPGVKMQKTVNKPRRAASDMVPPIESNVYERAESECSDSVGRTRRPRHQVNYTEPSLAKKLRRET